MEATDTDFQEKVIEKSKEVVVVVDFWADWCVPCNILGPVLTKVVESYSGKVELVKLNVDKNPQKSGEFQINAIPAVKIFKNGKSVAEFIGVVPEDVIKEKIDEALEQ